MTATENMLTLAEAAQELRMSRSAIQRLVRGETKNCPRLPAVPVGQRILIRRAALEQYILDRERAFAEGIQSPA